jgi:hypothetical protein
MFSLLKGVNFFEKSLFPTKVGDFEILVQVYMYVGTPKFGEWGPRLVATSVDLKLEYGQ